MKQHITNDQLKKLSKKGKEKLREFGYNLDSDVEWHLPPDEGLPLLSIGQMIEFLDEQEFLSRIERDELWEVQIPKTKNGVNYAWCGINKEELCDALWKACKEVLEENE